MLSHTFILAMARSYRFGSICSNSRPISDSVPLRLRLSYCLNLATTNNSLAHSSKGTQSLHIPKDIQLLLLIGLWFQVLFHSLFQGSFHFSLTVLYTIGVIKYLVLCSGLHNFKPNFSCSTLLRIYKLLVLKFLLPDYYRLWFNFPVNSHILRQKKADTT